MYTLFHANLGILWQYTQTGYMALQPYVAYHPSPYDIAPQHTKKATLHPTQDITIAYHFYLVLFTQNEHIIRVWYIYNAPLFSYDGASHLRILYFIPVES